MAIKRDDMTGCATGGNKIRKLEFLLADALRSGCHSVITAGGVQSNHARATAVQARELGLTPHVFLRSKHAERPELLGSDGNVLLHRLVGSHIYLVKPMPYLTGLLPKMRLLQERLLEEEGSKAYVIGIGGSDSIGVWGYIDAFQELMDQEAHLRFTDVVVAVGSGGTASGLAIGNFLAGSPFRSITAVSVCDTASYFYDHLDEMLASMGLDSDTNARNILNIIEAKGLGYAVSTDEELNLCTSIARETGILLDPVYTLKGIYGLLRELNCLQGSEHFAQDARILFIHTGGLFGMFDRRIEPHLMDAVQTWKDE